MRNKLGDSRGASAVEFALAVPVLLLLVFGMAQVGILFAASAGLKHAVAEGARHAVIFPTPSEEAIRGRIDARRFGLNPDKIAGPTISWGEDDGVAYADLTMSYTVTPDFVFFRAPAVTMSETKRAFVP